MTPEQRKAHLKQVAEKLKQEKALEAQKDLDYFKKMTSGPRWNLFVIGSLFCAIMAVLVSIDTFVDGKTERINQDQWVFDRSLGAKDYQSVWVNENDIFLIRMDQMAGLDLTSFRLTRSYIFGDNKYLSYTRAYEDSVTPLTYYHHIAQKRVSIYEWFPLLEIMLLIPLILVIIKRPKPWYKFGQYASIFLIFPGCLILLLTLIF